MDTFNNLSAVEMDGELSLRQRRENICFPIIHLLITAARKATACWMNASERRRKKTPEDDNKF